MGSHRQLAAFISTEHLHILINVLEAFSAFVLAVTMYGITRRVAEGVLGTLTMPSCLGLVWLAKAGVRAGCPGHLYNECAAGAGHPPRCDLLCRGGTIFSYLLLRGRMAPVSIAETGELQGQCYREQAQCEHARPCTGPLTGYYQWLPALVFQVVLWLFIKGFATPATKSTKENVQ